MPILPLVDLLILLGWTSLLVACLQKAIIITTHYRPVMEILGMSPLDFAYLSGLLFVFALALTGRTWVKLNEPRLFALRHRQAEEEARRRVRDLSGGDADAEVTPLRPESVSADRP